MTRTSTPLPLEKWAEYPRLIRKGLRPGETASLVEDLKNLFDSSYRKDPNGCWIWNGSKGWYGRAKIPRCGYVMAHRLSLYLIGVCLDGLNSLHKCDNPPCVNPEHLFPGTQKDNARDMVNKGRDFYSKYPHLIRRGEDNPRSILKEFQVRSAINMIRSGDPLWLISERLSVSLCSIQKIKSGNNWRHISNGKITAQNTNRKRRYFGQKRNPNGNYSDPPIHRGEDAHNSVLTPAIVIEARNMREDGYGLQEIADHFSVNISATSAAIYRRTWKHIP